MQPRGARRHGDGKVEVRAAADILRRDVSLQAQVTLHGSLLQIAICGGFGYARVL
jgi:hypothetical protein